MNEQTITVEGLEDVQRRIYAFGNKLGDKVVRSALRKGANLIKRAVQQQVPVRTGKLRRGFTVARSKIHRGRRPGDAIGVYLALRKGKNAAFYGRFLNDGWQHGKTKVPGRHFIQKAFDANKEKAVRMIVDSAEAGATLLAKQEGL